MNCNVLLIENSVKVIEQIKEALAPPQYNIILATSDQQAIDAAIGQVIHIVMVSTVMQNAIEIMERLRDLPGMRTIPVMIFLYSPKQPVEWKGIGPPYQTYSPYHGLMSIELIAHVERMLGLRPQR